MGANEKIAEPSQIDRARLLGALTVTDHRGIGLGFNPQDSIDATESTLSLMLGEATADRRVEFGDRTPTDGDIQRLRLLAVRRILNRLGVRRGEAIDNWWYRLMVAYGW